MKKWQYDVWQPHAPDVRVQRAKLKEMGEEGWELVSVQTYRNLPVLYFKKPAKE